MIGTGWAMDPSKAVERPVINIEAELLHWEQVVLRGELPGLDHDFSRLRPTLKFSHDACLAWRGKRWKTLTDILECAYDRQIEPGKRIDWVHAEQVIQAVWLRLGIVGSAWKSNG
ncbi:hypothetical protein ACWKWK_16650 [Pseudoxanthomonas beigongshangi]